MSDRESSASAGRLSRRALLKVAGIGAGGAAAISLGLARAGGGSTIAFIGTYGPHGQGIYRCRLDAASGRLGQAELAAKASNPSWLTLDRTRRVLYACNETSDFNGTKTGSVSAYAVQAGGNLQLLNTVSSGGGGPVHLSLHPSGHFAFVANYDGGNVAVFPLAPDGSLLAASDVQDDVHACKPADCTVGPEKAENGPPGSFAISGHDAPHAHMVQSDPSGRFVIANDLGLDRTIVWSFDATRGLLSRPRTTPSSAGAGPRHFAFHPGGRWLYSLNEESSTLCVMSYDPAIGSLSVEQEVSALPSRFAGTSFASEVIVSPTGRHLYCLNRLHDSISIFAIDGQSGQVRFVDEEWTRGSYPRSCSFDPSGQFLYVCNQRSDHVSAFRAGGDGRLNFTGHYAAVGTPAAIAFAAG
ncbi:lactonase family protein [Piscinibacter terrae]|uniref:Lactonase family protein n=1 Tax=Piscinibacter terrae TaxID=2496871 RepID=A0A3N7HNW2_9BURK|nr:lactonase family protein [Albitalea terrae]RQP23363.1 lactonase family protein [Albitalea terrae]